MKLQAAGESLLERFSQSSNQTPEGNAVLLAWVRIFLGLILCWRSYFIARDAVFYFDATTWLGIEANWLALAAWAYFGLAICLTVGLATRLVALILFLTIYPFGVATITFNLGPQIMMPMFAAIGLLHGGAVWSVDALLWRRERLKLPGLRATQSVKLTLFLFCSALHLAAAQFHLHDSHWLRGRTVEYMLTNSYLCRHYDLFRAWEANSPATLHMLSVSATIGQTVFQLAMIPLVFFFWGRMFVIAYGALFALISLAFLQISMLPWVELVLWAWLFMPTAWIPLSWMQTSLSFPTISVRPVSFVTKAFVGAYLTAMVLCVTQAMLANHFELRLPDSVVHYGVRRVGLMPPNVFNHVDLSVGDHWAMIYRYDKGRKALLPLNAVDGHRLRWHRSDLIYYANSLRWRRYILEDDPGRFHETKAMGHQFIAAMMRYDFRRHRLNEDTVYEVVVYGSEGAKGEFGNMERHQAHVLLRYSATVNRNQVQLLDRLPGRLVAANDSTR